MTKRSRDFRMLIRSRTVLALFFALAVTSGCDGGVNGSVDQDSGVDGGQVVVADGGGVDGGEVDGGEVGVDGGGGTTACPPQHIEACTCEGGAEGTRQCSPTGARYGECDCAAYGREIFVAVDGDDAASGDASAPLATLGAAVERVRSVVSGGLPEGGVVIWMAGGVYPISETVTLGSDLSGTLDRPIVIRAQPGAPVRLVGGVTLPADRFAPVGSSDPAYARIDPAARPSVRVIDLGAEGITDFGQLQRRGFCTHGPGAPMELFVDGEPMRLGRWPDADENTIVMPSVDATSLDLFGGVSPDVTGHYVRIGESDGVPSFARDGLVGGLQYHLYRYRWTSGGTEYRAWFLTTNTSGYPSDTNPWWYRYSNSIGSMEPAGGASGQVRFTDPVGINHGFAVTAGAQSETSFNYSGSRPSRWTTAPDAWLHGFWKYEWADCHVPIGALDTAQSLITMGAHPGYGVEEGAPWYAYNLLEEVTQPGEWYVDRDRGRLYLYPPRDLTGADIVVSQMNHPLVRISGAEWVELRGLVLEGAREDLLAIEGGMHNRATGITLRNAGRSGAVVSGSDNGLSGASVSNVGHAGVILQGGDRPSLTPASNFVRRSSLHHFGRWDWTYAPAVTMRGVAQEASNNLIYEAPHTAILFWGNEHRIEQNEIHHTNRFSGDAGAIYGGRDWGGRGVVIRHNHIHDLRTYFGGLPIVGVYLDDCLAGIQVEGNLLRDIDGIGVFHGGGRDVLMTSNVIVRADQGLLSDARCSTWGRPSTVPGDSHNYLEKLQAVGYQSPPWSDRYPECAAIPNNYDAILDPSATWLYPEGSDFSSNVGFEVTTWMSDADGAFSHYSQANDVELDASPFVNESGGDLRLTSSVLAVPGFSPIPVESIGLR